VPAGKARRMVTDEVMDAIHALSGQVRAQEYNERRPAG
jgi:1-acyl-sn-glycerol-3-phosphate acyltransferase